MERRTALALVAMALAGCAGDGGDDPPVTEPTVQTAPATTTTAAPADPFAVPQVIDTAYADRVLAELNRVEGDAVRELVATKSVTDGMVQRFRAIYNDPEFETQLDSAQRALTGDLANFRTPPGDRRNATQRVLVAQPRCMIVETRSDFSAVVVSQPTQPPDELMVLVLVPTQVDADAHHLNRTPWSIRSDEIIRAGERPQDTSCGS